MRQVEAHIARCSLRDPIDLVQIIPRPIRCDVRDPVQPQPDHITRHQALREVNRAHRHCHRVRDVLPPRADVRRDLHGVVLPGAELAQVVLFIRAILCLATEAHLTGADDAHVIGQLLSPDASHRERPAVRRRHIADLQRVGQDVSLGDRERPRHRRRADRAVRVDRQQGPQAAAALVPGLSQQEVGCHAGEHVTQVLALRDGDVTVEGVRRQEPRCAEQAVVVDLRHRQLGAVDQRPVDQVGEVVTGAHHVVSQPLDVQPIPHERMNLPVPLIEPVGDRDRERHRGHAGVDPDRAAVVRAIGRVVAGLRCDEVPRRPAAGAAVVGLRVRPDPA